MTGKRSSENLFDGYCHSLAHDPRVEDGMVIAERIGELPPEGAMGESNRLIQMEGR